MSLDDTLKESRGRERNGLVGGIEGIDTSKITRGDLIYRLGDARSFYGKKKDRIEQLFDEIYVLRDRIGEELADENADDCYQFRGLVDDVYKKSQEVNPDLAQWIEMTYRENGIRVPQLPKYE